MLKTKKSIRIFSPEWKWYISVKQVQEVTGVASTTIRSLINKVTFKKKIKSNIVILMNIESLRKLNPFQLTEEQSMAMEANYSFH